MADKDFKNNKIAGDYNHIDSVAEKTGNASNTALDSSAENNKKKEDLIKRVLIEKPTRKKAKVEKVLNVDDKESMAIESIPEKISETQDIAPKEPEIENSVEETESVSKKSEMSSLAAETEVAMVKDERLEGNSKETKSESSSNESKTEKVSLEEINRIKSQIIDEKKKALDDSKEKKENKFSSHLPPEESLPDDMVDEELAKYLLEEQQAQERAILEAEEKKYEGLTEEEIAQEKERTKKFIELRKRFNSKDVSKINELGDYQKNLDFTVNKGLKKFKVKPPKWLGKVIASISVAAALIVGIAVYIVQSRPPEPILLTEIKLSQDKTSQVVGEKVDLRGLYIHLTYSDGSQKTVSASNSYITRTSTNINSNYKITSYLNSQDKAYVFFGKDGQETKLEITLTQYRVDTVSVYIHKDKIYKGETISYDNILLLANTSNGDKIKINSEDARYVMNQTDLTKTEDGIVLPENLSGVQILYIYTSFNNEERTTYITFSIENNE